MHGVRGQRKYFKLNEEKKEKNKKKKKRKKKKEKEKKYTIEYLQSI